MLPPIHNIEKQKDMSVGQQILWETTFLTGKRLRTFTTETLYTQKKTERKRQDKQVVRNIVTMCKN